MIDIEKKLAFLLATSPHLDTVSGSYDEAAMDLVANGVVPVVRCRDCKHFKRNLENDTYCSSVNGLTDPQDDDFCSYGERKEG